MTRRILRSVVFWTFIIFLSTGVISQASERIDLNGPWQFLTDAKDRGVKDEWFKKEQKSVQTVKVPHTWNTPGKTERYFGASWYYRTFDIPESWEGKQVEVHFGATFYRSRVYLNGKELGGHEGGYTAYDVDLSDAVKKKKNLLVVRVDNVLSDTTLPGWALRSSQLGSGNEWFDWWNYGGIVRDVWLTADPKTLLRRQFIQARVPDVKTPSGDVTDTVTVENHSGQPVTLRVSFAIYPPDGSETPVAMIEKNVRMPAERIQKEVKAELKFSPARLWYLDQPNLYRLKVKLSDFAGNPLDTIEDNFGLKKIELKDRKLYLNGESVRLTGMSRHEDSPKEGLAESLDTMTKDWKDLKALNVTLARPVHYPQNPAILDFCDRNGILLIPEIPMWQFKDEQMANPQVIELAQRMMTEVIQESGNHACVFAWSTCNESATNTPAGLAYFKKMYAFIKKLDPDRYVSYADDNLAKVKDPKTNAASFADFIMWNEYFGRWHGKVEDLPRVFLQIWRQYPGKTVLITEFGPSYPHPEDDIRIHAQMDDFAKRDWIAGALLWSYQPYKTCRKLRSASGHLYTRSGVVDENGVHRPLYDWWKKRNAPARVDLIWDKVEDGRVTGFKAVISRRTPEEIPSYILRGYKARWEAQDTDGQKIAGGERDLPEIGPMQYLKELLPEGISSARIIFQLVRPTGFIAAEEILESDPVSAISSVE